MQTLFGLDVVVDDDLHARAAAEGTGSKTRTTSSAGSRSRRAKPLLAALRLRTPGLVLPRPPRGQVFSGRTRPAGDRPPHRSAAAPGTAPPRAGGAKLGIPAHLGADLAVGAFANRRTAGPPGSAHPFHHADSSPQSSIDSDFRISPASSCAVALTALAVSIRTRRRRCAAPNHKPPGQKSSGRSCSATTQSRCSTRMVSRSPSMLPTMS